MDEDSFLYKVNEFLKERINLDISDDLQLESLRKCIVQYGIMFIFIIFSTIIMFYASADTDALTSKTYVYAFSVIIPILLGIGIVMPIFSGKSNTTSLFAGGAILVCMLIVFGYYYSNVNIANLFLASYFVNIVVAIIIIIGLAIFYNIFKSYLQKTSGWSGLFVTFIFYIPCLVSDFIKYLAGQYQQTPNIVFILFLVEMLFIVFYLYAPALIQKAIENSSDSVVLLPGAKFLDNQIVRSAGDFPFTMTPRSDLDKPNDIATFRTNYGISMWVYINPGPMSSRAYAEETVIFDYGEGKPKLSYCNNCEADSQTNSKARFVAQFSNKPHTKPGEYTKYKISVPLQKWNYFVFNYNNNIADLFVNGRLERSYEFTDDLPSYDVADNISIGTINGLSGSICNVVYSPVPFTKNQIANSYNLLMYQNPPTNYVS